FPESAGLTVSCRGCSVTYDGPLGLRRVDGSGELSVVRGLARLRLRALAPGAPLPDLTFVRGGEEHRVRAADLSRVPVRGWLRTAEPLENGASEKEHAVLPALYTWESYESGAIAVPTPRRVVFSAVVAAPPGRHTLRLDVEPRVRMRIRVGSAVRVSGPEPRSSADLVLDGDEDRGRLVVIEEIE